MVVIVMGVSGSGKTTIGSLLAKELNVPFYDADDFHLQSNVLKMREGIPLTDDDREPWLKKLALLIDESIKGKGAILACSALKEKYRKTLIGTNDSQVKFVLLSGNKDLIAERMNSRTGHYMPSKLLDSQFDILECPVNAIVPNIQESPESICGYVLDAIRKGELYFGKGFHNYKFSEEEVRRSIFQTLSSLGAKKKVLVIPPDGTRLHSQAGFLTRCIYEFYGEALTDILPALGTHLPMTDGEIQTMFPGIPTKLFRVHNWRKDCVTIGTVPADFVNEVSGGLVDFEIPLQINKLICKGDFDLIISVGQVVPHEVIGMANYNKNIFIGTGGPEGISKSHFLGAAYGIENIMGRADNPVRAVLNYASEHFSHNLPILYMHTVVAKDTNDKLAIRGLYIGDGHDCFTRAAELSLEVNFKMVHTPLKKVVVYLDPYEFKSTWLGNKSIYRTRMAIENGGELVVIGPGVCQFGEDAQIDKLIRKYGYTGSQTILESVKVNGDLKENLSAAAHLILGSSEGRFAITYCPGRLTKEEVESVGFKYADCDTMLTRYDPKKLHEGYNVLSDGEEIYFISNPALGLWVHKDRFRLGGFESKQVVNMMVND